MPLPELLLPREKSSSISGTILAIHDFLAFLRRNDSCIFLGDGEHGEERKHLPFNVCLRADCDQCTSSVCGNIKEPRCSTNLHRSHIERTIRKRRGCRCFEWWRRLGIFWQSATSRSKGKEGKAWENAKQFIMVQRMWDRHLWGVLPLFRLLRLHRGLRPPLRLLQQMHRRWKYLLFLGLTRYGSSKLC